jgi:DNA repair protein RecO (recombination protein O)
MDPFTVIKAAIVERRGDTWRLDSADVVDTHFELRRDLSLIARAGYAVELVHELCRDREAHAELYARLKVFLGHLARAQTRPTDLLRFELEALAAVGLSPQLDRCLICSEPRSAGDGFDPARGGIVCRRCGERAARPYPEGAQLLAALQAGEAPAAERAFKEARRALEEFLQFHVGVRLRSTRFMAEVGVE